MGEKHGQWGWGYVYHKVWSLFFVGMFELNRFKAKSKHISGICRERQSKGKGQMPGSCWKPKSLQQEKLGQSGDSEGINTQCHTRFCSDLEFLNQQEECL